MWIYKEKELPKKQGNVLCFGTINKGTEFEKKQKFMAYFDGDQFTDKDGEDLTGINKSVKFWFDMDFIDEPESCSEIGTKLILKERKKQIDKHGFTAEHHFNHPEWYDENQLVFASNILSTYDLSENKLFPKNWDQKWFFELCKKDYMERLVISGALISSQLDLIDYKMNKVNGI